MKAKPDNDSSLFERIGGYPVLKAVHKLFYDKIFSHEWLKLYFQGVDRDHIEAQQTTFIAQAMGGPKDYRGKAVPLAHAHIFITEELFSVRHSLLREAIETFVIQDDLVKEWLKIDNTFKKAILKSSPEECRKRYPFEEILVFSPPAGSTGS